MFPNQMDTGSQPTAGSWAVSTLEIEAVDFISVQKIFHNCKMTLLKFQILKKILKFSPNSHTLTLCQIWSVYDLTLCKTMASRSVIKSSFELTEIHLFCYISFTLASSYFDRKLNKFWAVPNSDTV